MLDLPPELLGRLPLDQADLAMVARTSRDLRAAVRLAWAYRDARIHEVRVFFDDPGRRRRLPAICGLGSPRWHRPRGINLALDGGVLARTLHVQGLGTELQLPDPPVASCLRELSLDNVCIQDAAFWDRVFGAAPALESVSVSLTFSFHGHVLAQQACERLLELGQGLESLAIRCTGYHVSGPRGFALGGAYELPKLRRLVLTGPQLAVRVSGQNLRSAVLETQHVHEGLVGLDDLELMPCGAVPDGLPAVRDLELTLLAGGSTEACAAIKSLERVPESVERLSVMVAFGKEFDRTDAPTPHVEYGQVLAHLARLRELDLSMSTLTDGCRELAAGMLGVHAGVQRVTLGAARSVAQPWFEAFEALRMEAAEREGRYQEQLEDMEDDGYGVTDDRIDQYEVDAAYNDALELDMHCGLWREDFEPLLERAGAVHLTVDAPMQHSYFTHPRMTVVY